MNNMKWYLIQSMEVVSVIFDALYGIVSSESVSLKLKSRRGITIGISKDGLLT